ncbi:MAG: type III secretion system inner membrane ring lipoprotein SctJ [Roseinatronobacter sp.]
MARHPALIAITLAGLLLAGCKSEIYSNLSEREANQMFAALHRVGIEASLRNSGSGGVSVLVPQVARPHAMAALEAAGLPQRQFQTINSVFSGDGFVVSRTEEQARYIFAISEELSYTLSHIDGVLAARVHIVLPDPGPGRVSALGPAPAQASASVFLRHAPAMDLRALVPDIKLLVGNAVTGLEYQNVTVLLAPANHAPGSVEDGVPIAPRPAPLSAGTPMLRATADGVVVLGGLAFMGLLGLGLLGLGLMFGARARARRRFNPRKIEG